MASIQSSASWSPRPSRGFMSAPGGRTMPTRRLAIAVLSTSTLLSLLTCAGGTAWAANRYVNAATGSDASNDCLTQALPCKTIGHAIDQAAAGDIVTVGVEDVCGAGGRRQDPDTPGCPRRRVWLRRHPDGLARHRVRRDGGLVVTANGVTIDGFTIQGDNSPASGDIGITLGGGTSGARVTGNIVQGHDAGLRLRNDPGGSAAVVERNKFLRNVGGSSSRRRRPTLPSRGTASSGASSPSVWRASMSNRTST